MPMVSGRRFRSLKSCWRPATSTSTRWRQHRRMCPHACVIVMQRKGQTSTPTSSMCLTLWEHREAAGQSSVTDVCSADNIGMRVSTHAPGLTDSFSSRVVIVAPQTPTLCSYLTRRRPESRRFARPERWRRLPFRPPLCLSQSGPVLESAPILPARHCHVISCMPICVASLVCLA